MGRAGGMIAPAASLPYAAHRTQTLVVPITPVSLSRHPFPPWCVYVRTW